MQLHFNPRLKVDRSVLDAMTRLAKAVNEGVELAILGPTRDGWHGRLHYRKYASGFTVEVEDTDHLFANKRQFTRKGATRRMLRHIQEHEQDITDVVTSFVEKVDGLIAEQEHQEAETQQEA